MAGPLVARIVDDWRYGVEWQTGKSVTTRCGTGFQPV